MTRPPSRDRFYAHVRTPLGRGAPIRARAVAIRTEVPTLGWQVVHGSRDTLGRPNALSGTVLLPRAAWPGPGPRPVLSYGVGVHGLGRDAAPSHLLRSAREAELPLIERALERGWAVTISDGEGLGMAGPHTYGAGRAGGHALLDVAQAAVRLIPELAPESPVLLWGYSEGGRNAAWAAELQPAYAPELPVVAVAAGGVPSDLYQTAKAIDGGAFSGLNLAVLVGLARAYDDPGLWSILGPDGRQAAREAAMQDVVGLVVGFPEPLAAWTRKSEPWDDPAWRRVLARERNGGQAPNVPAYLYHVDGRRDRPRTDGPRPRAPLPAARGRRHLGGGRGSRPPVGGAPGRGRRRGLAGRPVGRTPRCCTQSSGGVSCPVNPPLPTFVEALAVLALQPFSELVGAELTAFSTGHAELRVPVRAVLSQQHGLVHGGVLAYAADNAMAFAGGSVLGPAVVMGDLSLQYVRPARGSVVRAVANVVTATGAQAVCRCEVLVAGEEQGELLCAVAQGTVRSLLTTP